MKHVSCLVPDEVYHWILKYCEGHTMSEKVRWYLCSHAQQREAIKERLEELTDEVKRAEESLKENLFSKLYKMPEDMKKALTDAKKIIKENPKDEDKLLRGRCNLFNNDFKKRMSIPEFKMLLDEIEDGT